MQDFVGIIGVGAMGGALLKGLINGAVEPDKLVVADADSQKLQQAADTYNVKSMDVRAVAETAKVIFLAVKPQDINSLLTQMAPVMHSDQVVVSVAAGITVSDIEQNMTEKAGVVRVMPNTPCLIGEGAMAVSAGRYVRDEDLQMIVSWLKNLGIVRVVPEKLMDAVTGVSGSGPAYVYLMIEALSDGGVLSGLPRDLSYELAVQTVLGSARMINETKKHPAVLREMVTSPAGTTASALFELEQGAFRSTIMKAVKAAAERSKELGR